MNPLTGGPCQGVRNLDEESRKLGIYREVVSLDDPSSTFLGHDPFPIHALGPDIRPWAYSTRLLPWLVDNLERFDVVIVNGLWLYTSYAVWKALRILKRRPEAQAIKVFIMPHGMLDPWFQDVKGREWKALRNYVYWKLIESRVVNDADGLLFTCETELLLARKPFQPYHPKREINVGYGVEEPPAYSKTLQKALFEKYPELYNKSYLLFLSRIHYKKGIDLLIKAYATIVQQNLVDVDKLPRLVIAGPGIESDYGKEIKRLVDEKFKIQQLVFFPGMLSGDVKWGAIYGCEAFILPSHQENFGIAVVEALACSKPVLISNQVNIWREIQRGRAGFISDDSVEGTVTLLKKWLCLTHTQKLDLSKNAQKTFRESFNIKQAAIKLFNAVT